MTVVLQRVSQLFRVLTELNKKLFPKFAEKVFENQLKRKSGVNGNLVAIVLWGELVCRFCVKFCLAASVARH